jgi:hypothetical protein
MATKGKNVYFLPYDEPDCDLISLHRSGKTLTIKCEGMVESIATAKFTGVRAVRAAGCGQVGALLERPVKSPLLSSLIAPMHGEHDDQTSKPLLLYRFEDFDDCPCIEVLATGCEISHEYPNG